MLRYQTTPQGVRSECHGHQGHGRGQTYDKGRTAAAVKDTPRQRRKWPNKGLAFRAWQEFGETGPPPEAVKEWLNKTSREGMI